MDTLSVPTVVWPHQPLIRTRSSPASTSLPPSHPASLIPSLTLSSPADVQLRFTTGAIFFFFFYTVNLPDFKKKSHAHVTSIK